MPQKYPYSTHLTFTNFYFQLGKYEIVFPKPTYIYVTTALYRVYNFNQLFKISGLYSYIGTFSLDGQLTF